MVVENIPSRPKLVEVDGVVRPYATERVRRIVQAYLTIPAKAGAIEKGDEIKLLWDRKGKRLIVTKDYVAENVAKRMKIFKRKVQSKKTLKFIYLPEEVFNEISEATLNRKLPYIILGEETVVYYY